MSDIEIEQNNISAKKIMALIVTAVIGIAASPLFLEWGNLIWQQYLGVAWNNLSSPQRLVIFALAVSPFLGYATESIYSSAKTKLFERKTKKFSGRPVSLESAGSPSTILFKKSNIPLYVKEYNRTAVVRFVLASKTLVGVTKNSIFRISSKFILTPIEEGINVFIHALQQRYNESNEIEDGINKRDASFNSFTQKVAASILMIGIGNSNNMRIGTTGSTTFFTNGDRIPMEAAQRFLYILHDSTASIQSPKGVKA